jgi:hypothetical protein
MIFKVGKVKLSFYWTGIRKIFSFLRGWQGNKELKMVKKNIQLCAACQSAEVREPTEIWHAVDNIYLMNMKNQKIKN